MWIEFSDGVAGEVDLSDMAGRGVFEAWNAPGYFDLVHIASHRSIAWDDDIELCPDALYMEITGKILAGMTRRGVSPIGVGEDEWGLG